MTRYLKYLSYVFRHKWYVFLEGRKLGVSFWQLFIHDWTKFLPSECIPYARCFRTPDGQAQYVESPEFLVAWNSHEKRHKHHWQYWVLIEDSGKIIPLPIPDKYRKEMLADWKGAGRALGKPDTLRWYLKNYEKIMLHEETTRWVEQELRMSELSSCLPRREGK